MDDQLTISVGQWEYRLFAPEIESYCDILLNRIDPIFEDVDAEQERAAEAFMSAGASWCGDDYQGAAEAAHEHARDTALQFMEMRAVFMATGVSGLFHLFEKQLCRCRVVADSMTVDLVHPSPSTGLQQCFGVSGG
jgi:hypothetical protein